MPPPGSKSTISKALELQKFLPWNIGQVYSLYSWQWISKGMLFYREGLFTEKSCLGNSFKIYSVLELFIPEHNSELRSEKNNRICIFLLVYIPKVFEWESIKVLILSTQFAILSYGWMLYPKSYEPLHSRPDEVSECSSLIYSMCSTASRRW